MGESLAPDRGARHEVLDLAQLAGGDFPLGALTGLHPGARSLALQPRHAFGE